MLFCLLHTPIRSQWPDEERKLRTENSLLEGSYSAIFEMKHLHLKTTELEFCKIINIDGRPAWLSCEWGAERILLQLASEDRLAPDRKRTFPGN